jgi:cobalt-zinc-cadmium efflux system outer membrane protein
VPRFLLLSLALLAGCRTYSVAVPQAVEAHVAAVAPLRAAPEVRPCSTLVPAALPEPADLSAVWQLALAYNPALREAAANLEAARGRRQQAGLYPNPRLLFDQDTIGTPIAPEGNSRIELDQEIVTAGKKRLDRQIAGRDVDLAALGLLGRKFDVLSRVRRAYYDYASQAATDQAAGEVVALLERGLADVRRQVEKAGRPRADLLRSEALLEQARISLAQTRAARQAAWRELAAEVGAPDLSPPNQLAELGPFPSWKAEEIRARVLAANTALRQADITIGRARLSVRRAEAEAVPNVTIGAGYVNEPIENAQGGLVTIETALPVWDRKQGQIHEAKALLVRAEAARRTTENRLTKETAAAFGGYESARQQVERLTAEVLPRLQESLDLLRKGYQAGAASITFLDVLQAEQALASGRLSLAAARCNLWLAIADLEALMQLDLGEDDKVTR